METTKGWVFSVTIKTPLGMTASHIGVPRSLTLLPMPASSSCVPWEAAGEAQVLGSLILMWDTQIELWTSTWHSPSCCRHLAGVSQLMRDLSAFQINKF